MPRALPTVKITSQEDFPFFREFQGRLESSWNDFDRLAPDPRQEQFCYVLVNGRLGAGEIARQMLEDEMARNDVRHDALEVVVHVPPVDEAKRITPVIRGRTAEWLRRTEQSAIERG